MNPEIQTILSIFEERGNESYGKEEVTQLQHALQCATLAEQEQADPKLIAAALLHDIGHLMSKEQLPADIGVNLDDGHEEKAHAWFLELFGPEVADPVRLHVAAKRYLCTVDASYADTLSPTSYKSFVDQGGVMDASEKAAFEAEPFYREAVRLRYWDDLAKDGTATTEPIQHFIPMLKHSLK